MITLLIVILFFAATIYIVRRLNEYIKTLEAKIEAQIIYTQNLQQSLNEIIAEGYLQNDGRLRKFAYQKETRNVIINGRSSDETVEL